MAKSKEKCRVCGKTPGKEFQGSGYCGKHQSYPEQMEAAREVEYAIRDDLTIAFEERQRFKDDWDIDEEEESLMYAANASGLAKYSQVFEGIVACRENDFPLDIYLDCKSSLTHDDSLKFISLGANVGLEPDDIYELGEGSYVDGLEKVTELESNLKNVNLDIDDFSVSPEAVSGLDGYSFERPNNSDLASFVKSDQEFVVQKIKETNPQAVPSDLVKSYRLWEQLMQDKETSSKFVNHILEKIDSEVS